MDRSARRTWWIAAAVVTCASSGVVGAAAVAEVALLRIRPRTPAEQAWRLAALTTLTTAIVAGLLGGVVGLVLGLRYPPTAFFAFLEGGLMGGAGGLLLGGLVGTVLGLDVRRTARAS